MKILMKKQGKGSQQPPTGLPIITGIATVSEILTADTSSIYDPNGIKTITYKWNRNGEPIIGATSSTYTLTEADNGNSINVSVNITDMYNYTVQLNSTSVGPVTSNYPYLENFNLTSFNKVVYVDGTNGNDANTGTNINAPKKTYNNGMSSISSGGAVIMFPGTYLANYAGGSTWYRPTFAAKPGTTVIALEPGRTIFYNETDGHTGRDTPMFIGLSGSNTNHPKLYGLVFRHKFINGTNYQKAIHREYENSYEIYNCAFPIAPTAANVGRATNYNNDSTQQSTWYNCTFGDDYAWVDNYSGNNVDAYNCAFRNDLPSTSASKGIDNFGSIVVPNANYGGDVDFHNTVDNNKGVYGGSYAWPKKPSEY